MEIMDGVNVALAVMGLVELGYGSYVLTTGRTPGGRVTDPEQVRKVGVAAVLFAAFFLLQVAGYLGERLGLFSSTVRGLLLLAALAAGAVALVKYQPWLPSRLRRRR